MSSKINNLKRHRRDEEGSKIKMISCSALDVYSVHQHGAIMQVCDYGAGLLCSLE